jgi:hypothetical protein
MLQRRLSRVRRHFSNIVRDSINYDFDAQASVIFDGLMWSMVLNCAALTQQLTPKP